MFFFKINVENKMREFKEKILPQFRPNDFYCEREILGRRSDAMHELINFIGPV
jgi:hypothetical protein